MKKFVLFLAFASVACGLQYDGFRVKFGWSEARADIDHFYKIPRTTTEAENEGWRRTERPPGPLPELKMYCPPGRIICPLYDTTEFIAGLQIALPVEDFVSPLTKLEKRFVKWHAPAVNGEPAQEFWTSTQYLVSEESHKAGAGPHIENGATLQDGGVWVKGPDGHLMRIPTSEAELNTTAYKKQNCIPNMGTHYYYKMTPELNCDEMVPWFALVNEGKLIGTGFQMFGNLKKENPKSRSWFEKFPKSEKGAQLTIPHAPKCFDELADKHGLISIHIYYTKTPWEIRCK